MQVQSRPIRQSASLSASGPSWADGNEYNLFQLKEKGDPVEIVYPTEGTPLHRRPDRRL